MTDLLLIIGVVLVQGVLAFMGVWVALKPVLPKDHWRWLTAFGVMTVFGVILTVWGATRANSAQGVFNDQIKKTGEDLQASRLEQAQMRGQLTTIQSVMEKVAVAGNDCWKAVAQGITGALHGPSKPSQPEHREADKELCRGARGLARDIREFESLYQKGYTQRMAENNPYPDSERDKQSAWWNAREQENAAFRESHRVGFNDRFASNAKYYRDTMFDRLSVEKRETLRNNNQQADISLNFAIEAGASNEDRIANYLEEIAKMLCGD